MIVSRLLIGLALNQIYRTMDGLPHTNISTDVKNYSKGLAGITLREAVEEDKLVSKIRSDFHVQDDEIRAVLDFLARYELIGRAEKDGQKYIFYR